MDLLKPFSSRGFVIGIGIAALAYLLGPQIKQGAKVVAVKGMQGAMAAGEAASQAVNTGRERLGNMVQNIGSKGDTVLQQMVTDMKDEREQISQTLSELMSTMHNMQEEIALLKEGHGTV